jgi:chorismate-pyruvate lyase
MISFYRSIAMHDMPESLYCGGLCRQTDAAAAAQGCGEGGAKCGLCPLAGFYSGSAFALPDVLEVGPDEVPEPYRSLLVHERDMTSTLENFHGGRTHVRVLNSKVVNGVYQREVILALDATNQPVEFGAVTIQLDLLPENTRDAIIAGRRPLGGILVEHGIRFESRPKAFIRTVSDDLIGHALRIEPGLVLYGRCNALFTANDQVISDIVEILPPTEKTALVALV